MWLVGACHWGYCLSGRSTTHAPDHSHTNIATPPYLPIHTYTDSGVKGRLYSHSVLASGLDVIEKKVKKRLFGSKPVGLAMRRGGAPRSSALTDPCLPTG